MLKKVSVGLLSVLLIGFMIYGCGRVVETNPNMSETAAVIPAGTSLEVSASNISVGSDGKSMSFNMAVIDQDNGAFTDLTKGNLVFEVSSPGPDAWTITYIACGAHTGSRNFSLAMTLDRSGSMDDAENSSLEAAALSLVGMKSSGDDIGVINFDDTVTVEASMTTNTATLTNAITNESVREGGTALYDSMGAAIDLVLTGQNSYKVVFAMTDGYENRSSNYTTTPEVAEYAILKGNIPLFNLAYGTDLATAELSALAYATGGLYYSSPSPEALVEIYNQLAQTLANAYQVNISGADALTSGDHTLTIIVKDENGAERYRVSIPFIVS